MDTELESMIVKLKGDATSYEKMVKDAEKYIRGLTGTMAVEDKKVADLARRSVTAVMEAQKQAAKEAQKEQQRMQKEREKSLGGNAIGSTVNAAWSITEKSFIQAIRSVDAMMSRTVASITNGIEGVVRVSVAAGATIVQAWGKVLNTITGGLAGAAGKLMGNLAGKLGDVGSFVNKWMGRIPEAIGKTLGAVGSVVGTILAGAFGIAGAAVVAFGGEMTRVFKETLEFASSAKRLGVSILDIRAGMLLTGASFSAFTNILGNVQVKIEEYKDGIISTTNQWKNFSAISGKSISELQKGGWESVFLGLQSITDSSDRATVAFSILGSEANKVLGALEKGGVGEAKGLAKRLGLEVDPASLRSLQQISQFTREVEALKTGLVNQVMLGLAPIAAELSSVFNLSKTDITWIKDKVTEVAMEIARWGTTIVAVFANKEIFSTFFSYLGEMFNKVAIDFEIYMMRALKRITDAIPGFDTGMSRNIKLGIDVLQAKRTTSEATQGMLGSRLDRQLFESPQMTAFRRFSERIEERRKQPPETDKSKSPPIMIEKLNQSFDQLINSLKQPIDMWRQSLNELIVFTKTNRFKGLGDEQALAAANMFKKLRESTGMAGTPQFAGAATLGSTEAYSAIAQFQAMQDRGDIQQQMKDAILQGNRQRELMINNGQAVLKALNDLGVKMDTETEADIS